MLKKLPRVFLIKEYLGFPRDKTNGKRLMEAAIVIGLNAELRGPRKERGELACRHPLPKSLRLGS